MPEGVGLVSSLVRLYLSLAGGICLGLMLGRFTSARVLVYLGRFLLWVGVPITIVAFLRQTKLSGLLWLAPFVAWAAILLGIGLAWGWLRLQATQWHRPTQGSFFLTSMVGNTGYLGYPVALSLLGSENFGWTLFYDLLGSTLGAYGLGIGIAAQFGLGLQSRWQLVQQLLRNPPLWSFLAGLGFRSVPLPAPLDRSLQGLAWCVIWLALILLGMRLSHLSSWRHLPLALSSLSIKMLVVPLVMGIGLTMAGIQGPPRLALVLQMAMPPAFATLVISEVYGLDKELTVTSLTLGSIGLLVTLPLWLWLFGH